MQKESKMTTKGFKSQIKSDLEKIGEMYNWNLANTTHRGYAFQLWAAQMFCSADEGFDTDPQDSLLKSQDLHADIVLEDSSRNHMLIAQCKYASLTKEPAVDEKEVSDFFDRHHLFYNSKWVKEHGSEDAIEALGDYNEKIRDNWSVEYYFVTTGFAGLRVQELPDSYNKRFEKEGLLINCYLLDFYRLKDYYVRSLSLESSIPKEVQIHLPQSQYFEKEIPFQTLIAVLKGNALRDLYKKNRESLFAWNIRGYLGNRGINNEIARTAENLPGDFFYFNNGVTAICTDYSIDNNVLNAKNFQIINGAQTIGALAKVDLKQEVEVLFRITKTLDVKTDKGINRDIIRFNNTQNAVKISDFRSNDPIQLWLENKFADTKSRQHIPLIRYIRKRGLKRGRLGHPIKFENLAKIRYSFLYEPTLVFSSPKDLWTMGDDKGVYEKVFGVEGQLVDCWSEEEFEKCLLGIGFYFNIEKVTKEAIDENIDLRYLRRMKFHALSLAGIFILGSKQDVHKLVTSQSEFETKWEILWGEARRVLNFIYDQAVVREKNTFFAFIRSAEKWEQMKDLFIKNARLKIS